MSNSIKLTTEYIKIMSQVHKTMSEAVYSVISTMSKYHTQEQVVT